MPHYNVKLLDIQWVCSFHICFIPMEKFRFGHRFIDGMNWFFRFGREKKDRKRFFNFFPKEFQRNLDSLIFDCEYRNKWKLWCAISNKNPNSVQWNQNEIWMFHPTGLTARHASNGISKAALSNRYIRRALSKDRWRDRRKKKKVDK